jgi:hypothetical protein
VTRRFPYGDGMMPLKLGAGASVVVAGVGLVLAGCGDSGERGDSQATTGGGVSMSGVSLTQMSAPVTDSGEDLTSTGGGSATEGGTSAAPGSTSEAVTGGGPKFDLGAQPMSDLGGSMDGPIIPTTCAEAASGKSTVGCRFYAVDMDSHDSVETSQYAVGVANVQLAGMANVTVEVKEGGVWTTVGGPQAIGPLDLFTFNLPDRHQDDTGVRVGGAYRVTSDVPVVAYQFNPVDGASSYLSDAAMLYPAAALDTVNHVTAWKAMIGRELPAQLRDGDRHGGRDDGDGGPEDADGGGRPGCRRGPRGRRSRWRCRRATCSTSRCRRSAPR